MCVQRQIWQYKALLQCCLGSSQRMCIACVCVSSSYGTFTELWDTLEQPGSFLPNRAYLLGHEILADWLLLMHVTAATRTS